MKAFVVEEFDMMMLGMGHVSLCGTVCIQTQPKKTKLKMLSTIIPIINAALF